MAITQTALLAAALSADAFIVAASVSIIERFSLRNSLILATAFGIVQACFFSFGFCLGQWGEKFAIDIFPIFGCVILSFLGLRAIKDGLFSGKCKKTLHFNSIFAILLLAVSVSIDALVAGIASPLISTEGFMSFLIVGTVTFILTFIGSTLASRIKNKRRLPIFAGIALIALGISFLF